jgi:hypothetical protein
MRRGTVVEDRSTEMRPAGKKTMQTHHHLTVVPRGITALRGRINSRSGSGAAANRRTTSFSFPMRIDPVPERSSPTDSREIQQIRHRAVVAQTMVVLTEIRTVIPARTTPRGRRIKVSRPTAATERTSRQVRGRCRAVEAGADRMVETNRRLMMMATTRTMIVFWQIKLRRDTI